MGMAAPFSLLREMESDQGVIGEARRNQYGAEQIDPEDTRQMRSTNDGRQCLHILRLRIQCASKQDEIFN